MVNGKSATDSGKKKSNGTLVSEHTFTHDLNRTRDVAKKMNADNNSAYLNTTSDYSYDPRDRLTQLVRAGDGADTETYVHDANNNVINQTIKGASTTFNYDRNRLLTATTGGATASYNYDPFGRLDTVTAAGVVIEKNLYDGFDHVIENRKNIGTGTTVTRYTYDPLDRTATKTTDAGGTKQKVTTFNYLGLSSEVLDEEVAGELTKSYQYSPWGQRLSQITHKDDGTEEQAYYGYNPHTDVEQLTDATGNTKATYGYTAYGKDNEAEFTGIDKPDATDPLNEPYNAYRFNAKRWDQASESYDIGFRDYSPGLNRFLTRDSYNGALADMYLGTNPWTGNRYAFGGGNPISAIEIDGHCWEVFQGACDALEAGAEWVDHNSEALTDLAVDSAEMLLGGAAMYGGIALIGTGLAACGVSLPALAGGITAPITGAACAAGGAAVVGGGALVVGGLAMAAHGGSNLWDDLGRLESPGARGGGNFETPKPDNPKKRDDKWLKKNGIDPHEVKDGLPGPVAHFDLYVDKNGNIFAVRKGADPNAGEYIGNVNDY
ncbi:RHS repeat-associated core domain-containing protein [Verrucosispora sp. WMMD703]|uniref:RHS repeat-associated core domain-containing protein n=1 Tax=Verrucosispora sp. WMMD703 TaxID=3403463 RepID=UPI003B928C2D